MIALREMVWEVKIRVVNNSFVYTASCMGDITEDKGFTDRFASCFKSKSEALENWKQFARINGFEKWEEVT